MSEQAAAVELKAVKKAFGEFVAVSSVDLTIESGAFVTLLGPSGCGKTTILRMIAGLEDPTSGEIIIKQQRVNEVPIHKRNLGLVFQNYALFPHKSVFDNVAFGLRYRKVSKDEIAQRVKRVLDIVRLPGVEKRLPAQLSGGQQQRIALARAIVIEPHVLLLDEPLSALDANLREEMRVELKNIQREIGITTVFVTHDQEEALSMSDKVVVMDHGVIEQVGRPQDVYSRPETRFVADFLGQSNILAGRALGAGDGALAEVELENGVRLKVAAQREVAAGQPVEVVIRAHKLEVTAESAPADEALNQFAGVVRDSNYLGGLANYFIESGGMNLQAINPIADRMFAPGDAVVLRTAPKNCVLLESR